MTGSIEAIAAITSATRPPSALAGIDCRFTKLGSLTWTRRARCGLVGPQRPGAAVGHQVRAELAARRLDRGVDLPGRHLEALGDQLEVVDQGLHRLAHDLLDVLERVAHAVAADGQLRGPGD